MTGVQSSRGSWNSQLGFVMAAAGSAVGLGNIWGFPNQVASNGGAAFLLVYILCCFTVGYPVMVAELAIGRSTKKNPVGAFKLLSPGSIFTPLIGMWGVLCGVMIMAFYIVLAGWTFGFIFEQSAGLIGMSNLKAQLSDLSNGHKNALFSSLFIIITVWIVTRGVRSGIERAAKTMMPSLILLLVCMIGFVIFQKGATEGLLLYLKPDLSKINSTLIVSALGQAFFSLSLGMGALITYGSYMDRRQNIPRAAALVTLSDLSIAFMAGLLIIPAMYVAQANQVQILDDQGSLISSTGLVFSVLPNLFDSLGWLGTIFGILFFVLLSIAALTSTISLLEVPASYLIDEWGLSRRKASVGAGTCVGAISIFVAYSPETIGLMVSVFNDFGLPLGGLLICLFLGFVWTSKSALTEMESGCPGLRDGTYGKAWSICVRYICPTLILAVLCHKFGILAV